ncbi:MAG: hypothetical protein H7Z77_04660 [Chitinophagaceae bacterium]|nr:hypothetical protein [Polaromonas sp.]
MNANCPDRLATTIWPVKAANDLDAKIELASQCEIVGYVLFLLVNPPLLLQIQNYPGQGLSPVEVKTLHDVLRIAGVNRANIWNGPVLSDDEVLGSDF